MLCPKLGKRVLFGSKINTFGLFSKSVHKSFGRCSWWEAWKSRKKCMFYCFRKILIMLKMGQMGRFYITNVVNGLFCSPKLILPKHFLNLFVRFVKLYLMAGIESWTTITVLVFEEKFILCSKWGKWFKCWKQGFNFTFYLFG